MITDCRDPFVRGAHKGVNTRVVRHVQNLNDALVILEADRLGLGLFFGEMVDAEELIVAEEDSFHSDVGLFHIG